jgi:hypothetical protein
MLAAADRPGNQDGEHVVSSSQVRSDAFGNLTMQIHNPTMAGRGQ